GDTVSLNEGDKHARAGIASTSGNARTFSANLTNTYTAAGTMRVADLIPGQTKLRIDDATGIEPGSYVRIDNGANNENAVIQAVDATNNLLTLAAGLTNTYLMGAADPVTNFETVEFTLLLGSETFAKLSMDPRHSRYFLQV